MATEARQSLTYVKLDTDTLDSSLWAESAETRCVWFALMLMAGPDGVVRSTAPGISRRANVPLKSTRAALELFERPDPDSRTPDADGRRIVRVDGGYLLVNYVKYRTKDHTAAERKRRQREREAGGDVTRDTVTDCDVTRDVTQAEANAEADTTEPPKPPAAAGGRHASETPTRAKAIAIADQLAVAYRHEFGKGPPRALLKRWRSELRQGVSEAELLDQVTLWAVGQRAEEAFGGRDSPGWIAAEYRVASMGGPRPMAAAALDWCERKRGPDESVDDALRRWAAASSWPPEILGVLAGELWTQQRAGRGSRRRLEAAPDQPERVA